MIVVADPLGPEYIIAFTRGELESLAEMLYVAAWSGNYRKFRFIEADLMVTKIDAVLRADDRG